MQRGKSGNRIPIWRPSFSKTGTPEVVLSQPYGLRYFIKIWYASRFPSSQTSAITKTEPGSRFPTMAAILKCRYDVITPPPIVGLLRNFGGGCKITHRWLRRGRNRNRKYNFNMATVNLTKPEVVYLSSVTSAPSSTVFKRQLKLKTLVW